MSALSNNLIKLGTRKKSKGVWDGDLFSQNMHSKFPIAPITSWPPFLSMSDDSLNVNDYSLITHFWLWLFTDDFLFLNYQSLLNYWLLSFC
jgi:hypothetical protein